MPALVESLVMQGKQCPYCTGKTDCVDSRIIYGVSYGYIWLCKPCNAYVGCHFNTKKALGRLANRELREAKKAAHAAFDPLWQQKIMPSRKAAYGWLAEQLGIELQRCHIGMFDERQCAQVIELCKGVSEPC